MEIRKLIKRLQQFTSASVTNTDYTVRIEKNSIIVIQHTEVDEIEVDDD